MVCGRQNAQSIHGVPQKVLVWDEPPLRAGELITVARVARFTPEFSKSLSSNRRDHHRLGLRKASQTHRASTDLHALQAVGKWLAAHNARIVRTADALEPLLNRSATKIAIAQLSLPERRVLVACFAHPPSEPSLTKKYNPKFYESLLLLTSEGSV